MKLNISYQYWSSITLSEMEFQITAQAFSQTDNYNANIQALVSQRGVGSNLPHPLFFVILFILQREKKISTENFSNFFLAKRTIVSSYYSYATRCNLLWEQMYKNQGLKKATHMLYLIIQQNILFKVITN